MPHVVIYYKTVGNNDDIRRIERWLCITLATIGLNIENNQQNIQNIFVSMSLIPGYELHLLKSAMKLKNNATRRLLKHWLAGTCLLTQMKRVLNKETKRSDAAQTIQLNICI